MPSHPFLLRDDENELASPLLPFTSIFVRFANGEALQISGDDLPDTAKLSAYATVRDLKEAVAERLSTAGYPGVDDVVEDAEAVVGGETRIFQHAPPTLIEFVAEQERDPSNSTTGDQTNNASVSDSPLSRTPSDDALEERIGSESGSTPGLFLPDHHPLAALSHEGRDELRVIIRGTLRSFANARVVRLPGPPGGEHREFPNQDGPWMQVEDGRATAEMQGADTGLDAVFSVWQKWVLTGCCQDLMAFVFPPSEDTTGNAHPVTLTRREFLREMIYMLDDCQLCSPVLNIRTVAYYRDEDEDEADEDGFGYHDPERGGDEYRCLSALTAAYAVDPQGAARDVLRRLKLILRNESKDSNPHAPGAVRDEDSAGEARSSRGSGPISTGAASAAVFNERSGREEWGLLWCAVTTGDEAFAWEVLTARSNSLSEDVDHPSTARETSFCFDLFDTLHSPVRAVDKLDTLIYGSLRYAGELCSGFAWMLKWSRSAQIWAAVLNRPELRARSRSPRRLFENAARAEPGDPYQSGHLLLLDAGNIEAVRGIDLGEYSWCGYVPELPRAPPTCSTLRELLCRRLEDPGADIGTCGSWYGVLAVFISVYLHDDDSDTETLVREADRFAGRMRFFMSTLREGGRADLVCSLIAHLRYLMEDLGVIAEAPPATWRNYSSTAEHVFQFLFYNEANAPLISDPIWRQASNRVEQTSTAGEGAAGPSSAPGAREHLLRHHEEMQRLAWVRNLLRKVRALLANLQRLWRELDEGEQRIGFSRTDDLLCHFRRLGVAQNGVCDFVYHIRNAQGDQEAWETRGEGLHSHNRPERQKKNGPRYSDEYLMAWEEQMDLEDLFLTRDVRSAATTKKESSARGRRKGWPNQKS